MPAECLEEGLAGRDFPGFGRAVDCQGEVQIAHPNEASRAAAEEAVVRVLSEVRLLPGQEVLRSTLRMTLEGAPERDITLPARGCRSGLGGPAHRSCGGGIRPSHDGR